MHKVGAQIMDEWAGTIQHEQRHEWGDQVQQWAAQYPMEWYMVL